jgi:hypothetical protein
MTPANQEKLIANNKYCNSLSDEQLFEMFKQGKCPREPEHLVGVPIGMFHCEVCGIMVAAGLPHPRIKWTGDYENGWADYPDTDEH